MLREKLLATLGIALLFAVGLATAAVADPLPTTPEPTTTTTTATDPPTTTTTSTSTVTTTASPEPTTTSAPPTTSTTAGTPPPRKAEVPRHALPKGSTVRDTPAGRLRASHPRRKKHRRRVSKPLRVTPPLGAGNYVFPVVGDAGYGDSYGGFRGDVRGKWHHGDDIFAPLGAPVVAVADGTVNRVGWHRIGGWRLWVRTGAADQFYYAHLSGYTPSIFHSRHVKAGQVIGFVGNTGDAFSGAAHLHFEVHPHQLLRLRYDGAVNPTSYLDSWLRMRAVEAPVPMHPRLPRQPRFRSEARLVFRQLLAVRSAVDPAAATVEALEIDRPEATAALPPQLLPLRREQAIATAAAGSSALTIPLLVGLLSVAVFVAAPVLATLGLGRLWRARVEER